MPFSNTQIELSDIPAIQNIEYKQLQKSYLNVNLVTALIFWMVVAFVFYLNIFLNWLFADKELEAFFDKYLIFLLIGFAVVALTRLAIIYLGFQKKGYAVREQDISYKTGLFFKTKTLIPFNRIQHSEVKQGPIERLFGIASLHIFTAGGSSSDLTIPGLTMEEANHLKQFIINRTIADGAN